jgi:DNA polymerase-3 subunit delta'
VNDQADIPEADRAAGAPHPRETSALFGQEAAEARFLEALGGGRLPHGWMIAGPRGVGKATLAWRIARRLLIGGDAATLNVEPADPVFQNVAALASPQVFLCRRRWDEKTKRFRSAIGIDEVRALKTFFQMSATDGGWRVAIVDAADEMTDPAANALLKVLEEPPERAVLLLVCHQPSRLLPTIRSRCRVLRCAPLGPDDLAAALKAAGADPAGVPPTTLAALAGGSSGAALRFIAQDGAALYALILGTIGQAPPVDRRRALDLANACAGRGAEDRFDLTLDLVRLALGRLALSGAGDGVTPIGDVEAEILARLASTSAQARIWAETVVTVDARASHARAVNLDPAQVILDTFLQIDAAAAKAMSVAA